MGELRRYLLVNDVLNGVGGLCGLLAVMIILAVTRYCRALMDRFSIRFTLAISLVDFLKALAIYLTSKVSLNPVLCVASGLAVNWLLLVYFFLNVAIAANLQMVFLKGKVNTPSRERAFWALSFAAATAIVLVPVASGNFGENPGTSTCALKGNSSFETYLWKWGCMLFWLLACCTYCTVIVILTVICLQKKASVLDRVIVCDPSPAAERAVIIKKEVRRLIHRVLLYCIIPALTHVGFLVLKIHMYHSNGIYFPLAYFSMITSNLPGVLNLLALLVDPAFLNAYRSITQTHIEPIRSDFPSNHHQPSSNSILQFPPSEDDFKRIPYQEFVRGL